VSRQEQETGRGHTVTILNLLLWCCDNIACVGYVLSFQLFQFLSSCDYSVLQLLPTFAGGFRPQAQVADEALSVLQQAKALEQAGCFALVLECVPAPIAAAVTAAVKIPTIGIGAGPATSGQV
jgi:hypothetical protein